MSTMVAPARIMIGAVGFDPVTAFGAAQQVRDALTRGEGGRLVVVDADLHRRLRRDPEARRSVGSAPLVLAASMSAVWASRLAARRGRGALSHPVPLAAFMDELGTACAADGWRMFLVGGALGAPGVPGGASRAAAILGLRHPGLRIAGCASPRADYVSRPDVLARLVGAIRQAKPDVVVVSQPGPPDLLVDQLTSDLPGAWAVECADAIPSVLGHRSARPVRLAELAGYTARLLADATASRLRPSRA